MVRISRELGIITLTIICYNKNPSHGRPYIVTFILQLIRFVITIIDMGLNIFIIFFISFYVKHFSFYSVSKPMLP